MKSVLTQKITGDPPPVEPITSLEQPSFEDLIGCVLEFSIPVMYEKAHIFNEKKQPSGVNVMPESNYEKIFSQQVLDQIFPPDRADHFFDALFGDVSEGAYDICFAYAGGANDRINFEFQLKQRPGKCLSCSLTYGLPAVFTRHPIIDVNGVVNEVESHLPNGKRCGQWSLGQTREHSSTLHKIPLSITVADV